MNRNLIQVAPLDFPQLLKVTTVHAFERLSYQFVASAAGYETFIGLTGFLVFLGHH